MGRAEILENKGEGRYRCQYKFDTETIAREQLILHNKVIELDNGLVKLTDEIAALGTAFTAANTQLQAVLAEPGAMTEERRKRLSAKLAALSTIGIDLKQAEATKVLSQAQKDEANARSLALSALPEFEERELWMADYSAEIQPTGADIPTIEVAGEAHGENQALLYPAKNEVPLAFAHALHGERNHALAISPAACFAAWAMLPAWQKYRPTFRVGKILEMKEGGFAKLELRPPLISSEQNLLIPPSDPMAVSEIFEKQTHERVPFEYMDCDSIAFKVGDEVLIQYKEQDSAQPVIIGFAHDPEPCSAINVFTSAKERLRYAPRKPGRWISVKNLIVPRFGSCYWVGDGGAVSWVGWRARYFAARRDVGLATDDYFTSPSIAHRGQNYGPCPGIVLGGCRRKGFLFAVCRVGVREVLCSCPIVGKVKWTEISGVDASSWPVLSPWYFSQSGTRAASAKCIGGDGFLPGAGTQLVELHMPTDKALPPFSVSFRVSSIVPNIVTIPPLPPGATLHEGAITTEHSFAVDFVGEALVTLDRRHEFTFATYFAPDKVTEFQEIVITCSSLNMEYLDFHQLRTRTATQETYVATTPHQIDHLNVTGGLGKVVSVTRRIDAARTDNLVSLASVVSASQIVTLTSGVDKLNFLPVTGTAAYNPSGSEIENAEYLRLQTLLNPYSSAYPVSYTVATRTGSLVTSMPLVALGRAMPPLPVSSRLRLAGGGPIGAG